MTAKTRRASRPTGASGRADRPTRLAVENVNHPGSRRLVDVAKYQAMRRVILTVLPSRPPGVTLAETLSSVLPLLPDALFPDGLHAGWWLKTVQLDLEAKRIIVRHGTAPLRLHRTRPPLPATP